MRMRKSLALAIALAGVGSATQSAPAVAQSANWAGSYVGVGAGGGSGQQSQNGGHLVLPACGVSQTLCSGTSDGGYDLSGGLVGGSIGYNFQGGRFVYGVEADASWADISGSGTCGFGTATPHGCGGGIVGLETVRGRFGYDIGPLLLSFGDILPFVSGGLAIGQIRAWDSLFGTSGDKSVVGWTIGGGFEAMLSHNWSAKVEYLHVDLGNPAVFSAIPPILEHVSTTAEIVRVGLDYHFNWTDPTPDRRPILRK